MCEGLLTRRAPRGPGKFGPAGHHPFEPFAVNDEIDRSRPTPPVRDTRRNRQTWVESRCGAVAVGRTYLLPPLSSGGASLARPWLCFHTPLIEPDVQISRVRLLDKTSRLRPRLAAPTRGQAYEAVMPVEVREWICPAPASPDLVLEAQPTGESFLFGDFATMKELP